MADRNINIDCILWAANIEGKLVKQSLQINIF